MVGGRVPLPPSKQLRNERSLICGFCYRKLKETYICECKVFFHAVVSILRPPCAWRTRGCHKKARSPSLRMAGPMPSPPA